MAINAINGIAVDTDSEINGISGVDEVNGLELESSGPAGIAVVSSLVEGLGEDGGTTAAINTTGANLIVVSFSWYVPGGEPTISDSKGNTWTGLTGQGGENRMYYCAGGTVGAGHTFTASGSDNYPAIAVVAVSGANAAPFEEENGTVAGTQPGSVTPDADGSLIVTSYAIVSGSQPTVAGYTNLTLASSAGVNVAGGLAYLIQPTAAAANPTWSDSGALTIAVFKPA